MRCRDFSDLLHAGVDDLWACEPIEGEGDLYEITAPNMLDTRDCITFVLEDRGDTLVMSDDGLTAERLFLSGLSSQDSKRRYEIIERSALRHGAQAPSGEMFIEVPRANFYMGALTLVDAIGEALGTMHHSSPNPHAAFRETLAAQIAVTHKDVEVDVDYEAAGATKPQNHFDLRIWNTREALIRASAYTDSQKVSVFLERSWFAFEDVRKTGRRFQPAIIFDDREPARRSAWKAQHFEMMRALQVPVFGFEQNQDQIEALLERV